MVLASIAMLALFGCRGWQSAADPQGSQESQLNAFFWLFVIASAIIWCLAVLALAVALWRRGTVPDPRQ